jgi:hypothetical protein
MAMAILNKYQEHQTGQGNNNDDTTRVLNAFLKVIKGPGHTTLCAEIYAVAMMKPNKMRELRNHLVEAILRPCNLPPVFSVSLLTNF